MRSARVPAVKDVFEKRRKRPLWMLEETKR